MVKKVLLLLSLFLVACQATSSTKGKNLIIFFDKNQTTTQQLLEKGKPWQLQLVYDYQTLHGMAVYVPNAEDIAQVKDFYHQQPEVFSVNEDQKMELH
ncbi:hypothetical protein [Pelistega ratti]|uniref:hypothetical protein n=1 Tax=Pelistega ratti TaxID=2652177 RepID=UPI0013583CFB|nr:hypothetical protein [Pelistega ratti]